MVHLDIAFLAVVALLVRGCSHGVANDEKDEEEDGAVVPVPKVAGTQFQDGVLHTLIDRTDAARSKLLPLLLEAHQVQRLQTAAPIQELR